MTASSPAYPSDAALLAALEKHFGHAQFRMGQRDAIAACLAGTDVVLVMPTGSGKSLCYQLPALLLPGVTLVVSPLIALMKDQVDALEARGIAATYLNSSLDTGEMNRRLEGVQGGAYKLIYIAPERFRNRRFIDATAQARVSLLTIDEAHCISQWGHDFRPDYLALRPVVERLPGARVMAVTATATPEVREDVVAQLGLGVAPRSAPAVHVHGFARPNLHLGVIRTARHEHKLAHVQRLVDTCHTGIVYCATRKMAERAHGMLEDAGHKPLLYHGALSDDARARAQEAFFSAAEPVVVATNAFGMGVDRRDLRFVVHWDLPGSVEAYYQEVGRAGRDGKPAWCDLLFNFVDVRTQEFFIAGANPEAREVLAVWEAVRKACATEPVRRDVDDWAEAAGLKNGMSARTALAILERAGLIAREVEQGQRAYTTRLVPGADPAALRPQLANLESKRQRDHRKLKAMLRYVDHTGCRHGYLLNYFGETGSAPRCTACDRCVRRRPASRREPNEEQWLAIQKVLSCVARMEGRFGVTRIAQVLRGEDLADLKERGLDRLSTFGLLKDLSAREIRTLLDALAVEGCLNVSMDEYRTMAITPEGRDVARRRVPFAMEWPAEVRLSARPETVTRREAAAQAAPPAPPVHDASRQARLARLKQWRNEEAHRHGMPAYRILNNRTLEALAAAMPQSHADLEHVSGMGPVMRQRYGRVVLDLMREEPPANERSSADA